MFIRNREKSILELLLKMSGKHTAATLAASLNVSERTVNRDMRSIEKLLSRFDLKVLKNDNHRFYISGANENIFKLAQSLAKIEPMDFSSEERKLILLLKLIDETEPVKLYSLSSGLDISVATLSSYLDELETWAQTCGLNLVRKRNFGVQLLGSESAKRKALGKFFQQYFNEDLIEAMFQLDHHLFLHTDGLILHYFQPDGLHAVQQAVNAGLESMGTDFAFADSDYITLIMQVYITFQRAGKGIRLSEADRADIAAEKEIISLVDSICGKVAEHTRIEIDITEKLYLAMFIKGSKQLRADAVYDDNVITGRDIKQLIAQVSEKIQFDLTEDFPLFQGLLTHLKPSIFRIRKNLGSYNPLTAEIKEKFPKLFAAVAESAAEIFQDICFPEEEIAYIVLHFGSALEQKIPKLHLRALIVCPTGIGASKMLETRIRSEVPYITDIHTSSIKEMKTKNLDQYDLILSTVRLPWEKHPYVYVNPLLSKEDVKNIRMYIQENIRSSRLNAMETTVQVAAAALPADRPTKTFGDLMDEIKDIHTSMTMLLKNFTVEVINTSEDYRKTLFRMADTCKRKGIITDERAVYNRLLEREKTAGLGIPGTNLALFHCLNEHVTEFVFQMAHLAVPCRLAGMDGKWMEVRNILLLLAPKKLSPVQREIMSLVSSSIIEDDNSILIFSSANEGLIREKLERSFYQFIKNKMLEE